MFALLLSLQGVVFGTGDATGNNDEGNPSKTLTRTEKGKMKIRITANGKSMTATMADNETARDFVAMLPLTLAMGDLFEREKFGHLPKTLALSGPREQTYRVGQIGYWSPKNDVAIFYRHDGQTIPEPGIIVICEVDAGVESLDVPGRVTVTFEVAQ